MSRLVVLALGVALVALLGHGPAAAERETVLGLSTEGMLARYDALTLRQVGTGLKLSVAGLPWRRSPDGSRIALASGTPAGTVLLADTAPLRRARVLRPRVGFLVGLAWTRSSRLLALGSGRLGETARLALLDARTGAVLRRTQVPGQPVAGAATPDGLVLLLGPRRGIGRARLVEVDDRLRLRAVDLSRVRAGWVRPRRRAGPDDPPARMEAPGVAVDPAARRAWVVGSGRLAEIDLDTRSVVYRTLRVRRAATAAKSLLGTGATALWLGQGRIAVTGLVHKGAFARALGLSVVDVRTGGARLVDPFASWMERAGNLLVTWTDIEGIGVFDLAGRARPRVLSGRNVAQVAFAGRRALVQPVAGADGLLVDLPSGRVLARRPAWPERGPYAFLLGEGSPIGVP